MSAAQILNAVGPYLLAAGLAVVPALVEMLRTFGRRVGLVLRSRIGWAILGLNALTGLDTLAAVKWLFGVSNDWLTAAVAGLTFPTLLRSPLIFVKGVEVADGEAKENALRVVAELYDQLLRLAREDADVIVANERTRLAVRLAGKHKADALAPQVQWRISQLLDRKLKARLQKELDRALAIPDERDRDVAVAMVALDGVPRSTIREWLRRRKALDG